jgi:hypothetical protein
MSYHSTPATHSSYCNGNSTITAAATTKYLSSFFQPKIVLSLYIKFAEAIGNVILTEIVESFVPKAMSYLKVKSQAIPVTGLGGL